VSGSKLNLGFQSVLFSATEKTHTENTEKSFLSVFSVRILPWLALHLAASNFGIEVDLEHCVADLAALGEI